MTFVLWERAERVEGSVWEGCIPLQPNPKDPSARPLRALGRDDTRAHPQFRPGGGIDILTAPMKYRNELAIRFALSAMSDWCRQ